jgi:hypothetical protein
VISRHLAWWTVPCGLITALVVHQQAAKGMAFFLGLPIWVMVFIGLQVGLTMAAVWIARS